MAKWPFPIEHGPIYSSILPESVWSGKAGVWEKASCPPVPEHQIQSKEAYKRASYCLITCEKPPSAFLRLFPMAHWWEV